ncbi:MAG: hypothetical protein Q9170_000776 [Blastenia crenularia]
MHWISEHLLFFLLALWTSTTAWVERTVTHIRTVLLPLLGSVVPSLGWSLAFLIVVQVLGFAVPQYGMTTYQWPMYRLDGIWAGPLEISYPRVTIMSEAMESIIVAAAPSVMLLIAQIWVCSFIEFHAAVTATFVALDFVTITVLPIKRIFPSLRPTFLDVCQPIQQVLEEQWKASSSRLQPLWVDITVCRSWTPSDHIDPNNQDSLTYQMDGAPSGMICSYFALACVLTLNFNAKLKPFQDLSPLWKRLVLMVPFVGAVIMALIKLRENNTTPWIAVASMLIGVAAGCGGYRTQFYALFDYNLNHIPKLSYTG